MKLKKFIASVISAASLLGFHSSFAAGIAVFVDNKSTFPAEIIFSTDNTSFPNGGYTASIGQFPPQKISQIYPMAGRFLNRDVKIYLKNPQSGLLLCGQEFLLYGVKITITVISPNECDAYFVTPYHPY